MFSLIATPCVGYEDGFHISTGMGLSMSEDSRLTTRYTDSGTVVKRFHEAQWLGRPFTDSTYYTYKLENWSNGEGLGFEFVHHKIYLRNFPDYLQRFSVSDGYNLMYLNKGWKLADRKVFRLGVGVVLAHPDVQFTNGEQFHGEGGFLDQGFFFAGPTVQATYSNRIWESERHYADWETKFSVSYAKFPISVNDDDYAEDVNIAVHFLINIGSKPLSNKQTSWEDHAQFWLPAIYPFTSGVIIEGGIK